MQVEFESVRRNLVRYVAVPGMILAVVTAAEGSWWNKPEYAVSVSNEVVPPPLQQILGHVPALKHERAGRWPMILWECGEFKPQPPDHYRQLLARGLTQHIQLDTNHIPVALALRAAGSPVIMMQGAGGPWPAQLAGHATNWAHRLDAGYKPESYVKPCLGSTTGWAIEADVIRATLRRFKEAGVTVDAVWLDWEGDPMSGLEAFEQASHCSRCRDTLPASVLATPEAFHTYRRRLYLDLLSAYLAAPVREIFPKCEVTNWMVVWSTPERPLRYWNDRLLPPTAPRSSPPPIRWPTGTRSIGSPGTRSGRLTVRAWTGSTSTCWSAWCPITRPT